MYLNTGKIWVQRILYGALGVVLTGLSFFFVMGIMIDLSGAYSEPSDNLTMIIYLTFWFIFTDVLCIKAFKKTLKAAKISRILAQNTEGLIAIEEVTEAMHMKQEKFVKLFVDCVSRALLVKCSFYAEDPTFILLENGAEDVRDRFAVIHCKQCGGPNAVQIGFHCKCKYCGTEEM